MHFWKWLPLTAYYHGTYPWRAWSNARRARCGRAPVTVLFYHRIADDSANAWTAPFRLFQKQVFWLRERFDLVSLAEAQRRLRKGRNDRACVSITFDDGYADNCRDALPLLIREQIPCTYFVATRHVLENRPFAHDVALRRPLAPNTPDQIRALARAGVEIGAHTRTHADLGQVESHEQLHDEVIGSREELEDLTQRPVRYFAFPFGQHANLSAAAFRLAREAGYEAACSAYGGFNFPGDDPFHLQRIHADDDMLRLKNWTTVDPRKLRAVRRYRVPPVPASQPEGVAAL